MRCMEVNPVPLMPVSMSCVVMKVIALSTADTAIGPIGSALVPVAMAPFVATEQSSPRQQMVARRALMIWWNRDFAQTCQSAP